MTFKDNVKAAWFWAACTLGLATCLIFIWTGVLTVVLLLDPNCTRTDAKECALTFAGASTFAVPAFVAAAVLETLLK